MFRWAVHVAREAVGWKFYGEYFLNITVFVGGMTLRRLIWKKAPSNLSDDKVRKTSDIIGFNEKLHKWICGSQKSLNNRLILDFLEWENFGFKIEIDVLVLWYFTKRR